MAKKINQTKHSTTKRLLVSFVKEKKQCVIFKRNAFPPISEFIKASETMRLNFNYFKVGLSATHEKTYISSFNGGKCYLMEKKLFLSLCKIRNIIITEKLYRDQIICDYGEKDLPKSKSAKKHIVQESTKNSVINDVLDRHNTESYMADNAIMAKLTATYSSKDWIETKRSELQMKANVYERNLGAYFINNGIRFVHQAPFIINNKIYFLDFYLPQKRIAIEVDGISHEGTDSRKRDASRDKDFATIGIKTYRINNAQTKNVKSIDCFLRGYQII